MRSTENDNKVKVHYQPRSDNGSDMEMPWACGVREVIN